MAEVVDVVAKPFRQFVAEDLAGHESFTSEAEMLETYRRYYPEENVNLDKGSRKIAGFYTLRLQGLMRSRLMR